MSEPGKNITEKEFEVAGKTDAIGKVGKVEAKKNMYNLLKMELEQEEMGKPQKQY